MQERKNNTPGIEKTLLIRGLGLGLGSLVYCILFDLICAVSAPVCFVLEGAKESARDPSMVGQGVARLRKSRYDSISTYLHYCKRREENPMHVLEVSADDTGAPRTLLDMNVRRPC